MPPTKHMTLHMTLEEWLDEQEISQKSLAAAIAKDNSYISKLIRFEIIPSLPVAILIAKISGGKIRPENLIAEDAFKKWCIERHTDPLKVISIINGLKRRVKQKSEN